MPRQLRAQSPGAISHVMCCIGSTEPVKSTILLAPFFMKPRPCKDYRPVGQLKGLAEPVPWSRIVWAVEQAKGERWAEWSRRHGDWGQDAALWLGRRRRRLSLARLGALAGEMDYAAVSQALSRFGKRLAKEARLRAAVRKIEAQLSNVGSGEKPPFRGDILGRNQQFPPSRRGSAGVFHQNQMLRCDPNDLFARYLNCENGIWTAHPDEVLSHIQCDVENGKWTCTPVF